MGRCSAACHGLLVHKVGAAKATFSNPPVVRRRTVSGGTWPLPGSPAGHLCPAGGRLGRWGQIASYLISAGKGEAGKALFLAYLSASVAPENRASAFFGAHRAPELTSPFESQITEVASGVQFGVPRPEHRGFRGLIQVCPPSSIVK